MPEARLSVRVDEDVKPVAGGAAALEYEVFIFRWVF